LAVLAVTEDAGLVVEALEARAGSARGRVRLPSDYTAEHVRLGYAATGHSSQGKTVDSVAVVIDGSEDANWLYSAITRARRGATLFVATEATEFAAEFGKTPPTCGQVLQRVLRRDGEKLAAVAELVAAQDRSDRVQELEALATAGRPTSELVKERRGLEHDLLVGPSKYDILALRSAISRARQSLAMAEDRHAGAAGHVRDLESAPRWRRNRRELGLARDAVAVAEERKQEAKGGLLEASRALVAAEAKVAALSPGRERISLIDAALAIQVRGAVESPAAYLETALGHRPHPGTPERDRWDQGALRLETYRHTELGRGPDEGALGPGGVEAAIGPSPRNSIRELFWDHAAYPPEMDRQVAMEIELGLDL